jgi:hypothetical protein
MALNNRIFYACQAVAICKEGHTPAAGLGANAAMIKGVQSVGITSNFTLDQAFELGQIEIYENSEEIADIEVTIEKVIDGEKLIYGASCGNSVKTDMVAAGKNKCDIYLGIYTDADSTTDSDAPLQVVMCSGMFISSVSYTYPSDGNATESCSFVGNDKFWTDNTAGVVPNPKTSYGSPASGFDGTDTPASGLVRRTNVDVENCTLPAAVKSQSSGAGGKSQGHHIVSMSASTDFGRESIMELGKFGPYHRYAGFPVEVTSEFEVTAASGDLVNVSGSHPNLPAVGEQITLKDDAGTVIDLGAKNKLSSVSYSGGDTGGGNATVTYSYSTFNTFNVNGGGTYW